MNAGQNSRSRYRAQQGVRKEYRLVQLAATKAESEKFSGRGNHIPAMKIGGWFSCCANESRQSIAQDRSVSY